MKYCFDQFAANMNRLRQELLAAAFDGEEVELTFVVSDPAYTAGSLYLRIGEDRAWIRLRETIGPDDDAFQCVVGSRPDSEAVEGLMTRAFEWLEALQSPRRQAALALEKALRRALALADEASVENDPLARVLREALELRDKLT